jgi:glycosyltransferase involved in cell wall biosynthesis
VQDGVTGYLVDGRSIDAVAAAITRLVRDAETRARMGAAAREWALGRFTFERLRREIEGVVVAVTATTRRNHGRP